MIYIFFTIHIMVCFAFSLLIFRKRLRSPICMIPLLLFIPFFGVIAVLYVQFARSESKSTSLANFSLLTERYESIFKKSDTGDTVPLADALLLDDAATRRSLMLDALSESPEKYVSLFRNARSSSDSEISHYAATALAQLDKTCFENLTCAEITYEKEPLNEENISYYILCIEKCLTLCEPDSELKSELNTTLENIIKAAIENNSNNETLLIKLFDFYIKHQRADECNKLCERIKEVCTDGQYAMCMLKLYFARRDSNGMKKFIEASQTGCAFFKKQEKQALEYWKC